MLVLYVAYRYDYGGPHRGYSYEHNNFYDTLLNMGHDVLYFDVGTLISKYGKRRLSDRLLEVVATERPQLMFVVLFRDELEHTTLRQISDFSPTVTLNWFTDDHWRFERYSRYWAPDFNWVVTTATSAIPKYQVLGYRHVIKSQWACNQFEYRDLGLPQVYDVSFVGLPHGNRPFVVQAIQDAGIDLHVWGHGWPRGRVSQAEMIRIFNQSRVNLNLSNSSMTHSPRATIASLVARQLVRAPLHTALRSRALQALALLEHAEPARTYQEQIKGRTFEVPGTGGFLLSGPAENLADYYTLSDEIAVFTDVADLIAQARRYLQDEERRRHVAAAGYRRTLAEHTYVHRFDAIFQRIGLAHDVTRPPGSVAYVT